MVVSDRISLTPSKKTITRRRLQYKCLLICLSFAISNKLQIWSKWKVQTHQTNRNQHSYSWLCTGISSCGKWWMKWYTLLFTHKKPQNKTKKKKRNTQTFEYLYTLHFLQTRVVDWLDNAYIMQRKITRHRLHCECLLSCLSFDIF